MQTSDHQGEMAVYELFAAPVPDVNTGKENMPAQYLGFKIGLPYRTTSQGTGATIADIGWNLVPHLLSSPLSHRGESSASDNTHLSTSRVVNTFMLSNRLSG